MRFLTLLILASLPAAVLAAETPLGVGRLLIADKDLHDPHFEKTVILLIHYDEEGGAGGLILTRPTETPISNALHDFPEAKENADMVYEGGPVATRSVLAVIRSKAALEDADRVLPEVYAVNTNKLLRRALKDKMEIRVFAGYAGWGPGQLEEEVDEGAWHVDTAKADLVFDNNPENLWHRLTLKLDSQFARAKVEYRDALQFASRVGSVPLHHIVRENTTAGRDIQSLGSSNGAGKGSTSGRAAGHDRI